MLNSVSLMGRLTADPELRQTPNQVSVCAFCIAVQRNYGGKDAESDFINIVAWRQAAEFVNNYFRKGQMIAVDGYLQSRKYKDKDGNNRVTYEVVANHLHFCGGKNEQGTTFRDEQHQPTEHQNFENGDFEDFEMNEEDLPF